MFSGLTAYIYINKDMFSEDEELVGDAPVEMAGLSHKPKVIGGTIKEDKVTDIAKIAEMQTDFALYYNGKINFDDMTNRNITNLTKVFNYPYKAQKGWLFSAGYDENSKVQVYAQSSLDDTRTVIYKVTYNDKGNKVEKIYDGTYFKLTAVDQTNPNQVIGYDANHDEHIVEVAK